MNITTTITTLIILLSSCSHNSTEEDFSGKTGSRDIASWKKSESNLLFEPNNCSAFNSYSSEQKLNSFLMNHIESIEKITGSLSNSEVDNLLNGNRKILDNYVIDFLKSQKKYAKEFFKASSATAKFLIPSATPSVGHRSLRSTFNKECDVFSSNQVKKVHALGSIATAKFIKYPKLKELNNPKNVVPNPFTGLLSASDKPIELLLRFSIANPVGGSLNFKGKNFFLEFIPGLGIKFLIDNKRNVDLVAMDSLAGQKDDHNFFKYEFSPDFSKNAPSKFNAQQNQRKKSVIMRRYNYNPVNHNVMNLVGRRFAQAASHIYKIPLKEMENNSNNPNSIHPFSISIEDLARINRDGTPATANIINNKRPWRLVFRPILNKGQNKRINKALNSAPYKLGKHKNDFRYKLSYLKPGDDIYQVISENENGKRFIIGKITLTSSPIPSDFGDEVYFIKHKLERARVDKRNIVQP